MQGSRKHSSNSKNSGRFKIVYLSLVLGLCGCYNSAADHQGETKTLYQAINKSDTATLKVHLTDKNFDGQFEINYHGLYKDSGDVNGVIKGDTLKGTYHFQHYGVETWYRIPIALLKKEHKLIMGIGSMEVYMNMTFFTKTIPIDYHHPKFIFERRIN